MISTSTALTWTWTACCGTASDFVCVAMIFSYDLWTASASVETAISWTVTASVLDCGNCCVCVTETCACDPWSASDVWIVTVSAVDAGTAISCVVTANVCVTSSDVCLVTVILISCCAIHCGCVCLLTTYQSSDQWRQI